MNPPEVMADPGQCPLCGQANDCQLCTTGTYKGPCWCAKVSIPEELLAQIPDERRNQACLCRACVMNYHRARAENQTPARLRPGDFYFEDGYLVFTAAHHLRRGYCCGSGCRHCPYG
jgi:hypothetical protein